MKVLLPIIWHELTHCIAKAWEDAGHEVRVFDWRSIKRRRGRTMITTELVAAAREFRPDLCWMQIQSEGVIDATTCASLKKYCGYVTHWCGDVRHPIPDWYLQVAPYLDCALFSNGTDVDIIRSKGWPAAHLQIGYDPNLYYPGDEPRSGVVFIGNNYGGYKYAESESRREMVKALSDTFGDQFTVYGMSWGDVAPKNNGGYLNEPNDADVLRSAKVAVNWDHFHRPWFASDRLIRAAACGCDVISQWYEGIDVEHPGVFAARNIEELVGYVKTLLEDGPFNGEANSRNTRERHTWDARVPEMLKIMEKYPAKR